MDLAEINWKTQHLMEFLEDFCIIAKININEDHLARPKGCCTLECFAQVISRQHANTGRRNEQPGVAGSMRIVGKTLTKTARSIHTLCYIKKYMIFIKNNKSVTMKYQVLFPILQNKLFALHPLLLDFNIFFYWLLSTHFQGFPATSEGVLVFRAPTESFNLLSAHRHSFYWCRRFFFPSPDASWSAAARRPMGDQWRHRKLPKSSVIWDDL